MYKRISVAMDLSTNKILFNCFFFYFFKGKRIENVTVAKI